MKDRIIGILFIGLLFLGFLWSAHLDNMRQSLPACDMFNDIPC